MSEQASEHILDELDWRGLITQSTDLAALRGHLDAGPVTLYAGFDPTAASLHAGHLVQLLTLTRFQQAGHRPVVLAGGATGQIGDPRELGERPLASTEDVAERVEAIGEQLESFVTFDSSPSGAILENNLNWFAELSALRFLREVGKHFSLNVLLARDTVRRRLATDGMSYTEFSYGLLQAYDFAELYRRYGTTLQVGGSDQWGNIIGGVDYVRKVDGAAVHALTTPLVTDSTGAKFGKSTGGGNIWLDPELTSPYAFYQYFVTVPDSHVLDYLRMFTFRERGEIDEYARLTAEQPQRRAAAHALAEDLTTLVHGAEQTRKVIAASKALFGQADFHDLDEATLDSVMAEVPTAEVSLGDEPSIVELLLAAGLVSSKGAARRTISEGGAYVNNHRISEESWQPTAGEAVHGRWLIVRKGKRQTAGVAVR